MDQRLNEGGHLKIQMTMKTAIPNLWSAAKAVLKGKFIVKQVFFKKQEKPQTNNLTYHLKELEKEEQNLKSAKGWT